MYSGIVQALVSVMEVHRKPGLLQYSLLFPDQLLNSLQLGASVAVDGVCQTVVRVEASTVWFDAIEETLQKTTLNTLEVGQQVNLERSLAFGDEIGGHLMAGHVLGTAKISKIRQSDNNRQVEVSCDPAWMRYILHKGFISVDGCSLTVGDVHRDGKFELHLIPETLQRTTLGSKREGDRVNIELDPQTYTIVTTVERVLATTVAE